MPYVEASVREVMGLVRDPDATNVRAEILRAIGITPPSFSVLGRCDEWFVSLANELAPFLSTKNPPTGGQLEEVVDLLAGKVHVSLAAPLLAVIAPQAVVSSPAGRLPAHCKQQIRERLPDLCTRLLAAWKEMRTLPRNDLGPPSVEQSFEAEPSA